MMERFASFSPDSQRGKTSTNKRRDVPVCGCARACVHVRARGCMLDFSFFVRSFDVCVCPPGSLLPIIYSFVLAALSAVSLPGPGISHRVCSNRNQTFFVVFYGGRVGGGDGIEDRPLVSCAPSNPMRRSPSRPGFNDVRIHPESVPPPAPNLKELYRKVS